MFLDDKHGRSECTNESGFSDARVSGDCSVADWRDTLEEYMRAVIIPVQLHFIYAHEPEQSAG